MAEPRHGSRELNNEWVLGKRCGCTAISEIGKRADWRKRTIHIVMNDWERIVERYVNYAGFRIKHVH